MNNMKKFILIIVYAICIIGCTKNSDPIAITTTTAGNATVQVYNAAISTSRNYIYLDSKPIVGSALAFAAVLPTTYRFVVTPGTHQVLIKDTLPTTTQSQLNFTQAFDADADYSIFMYDTSTTVKQKTVKNNISFSSDTIPLIRFANFIYSPNPLPALDVYSVKKGINIFSNVSVADVTNFVPYVGVANDTIQIRQVGTTISIINLIGLNPAPNKRIYTLILNGRALGIKGLSLLNQ